MSLLWFNEDTDVPSAIDFDRFDMFRGLKGLDLVVICGACVG